VFSFLLAAASAGEPAQADVVLRYEAATVSVTVTFQVAQRPSFHGVSVRPSGRLRGLVVPSVIILMSNLCVCVF